MNTLPTLEETRVIKPFLQTYKPEHGREYTYTFSTPIHAVLTEETVAGKFKAYQDEALDLTVSLHGTDRTYNLLKAEVTSTRRRYRAPFYEDVRTYLTHHLCTAIENNPAKLEQIVRALVL